MLARDGGAGRRRPGARARAPGHLLLGHVPALPAGRLPGVAGVGLTGDTHEGHVRARAAVQRRADGHARPAGGGARPASAGRSRCSPTRRRAPGPTCSSRIDPAIQAQMESVAGRHAGAVRRQERDGDRDGPARRGGPRDGHRAALRPQQPRDSSTRSWSATARRADAFEPGLHLQDRPDDRRRARGRARSRRARAFNLPGEHITLVRPGRSPQDSHSEGR